MTAARIKRRLGRVERAPLARARDIDPFALINVPIDQLSDAELRLAAGHFLGVDTARDDWRDELNQTLATLGQSPLSLESVTA